MTPRTGNSALYEGWLSHSRSVDVTHGFGYQLALCYLDLDEVDAVMADHPLWSSKHISPVRFRRGDYLGREDVPLADAVRTIAELPDNRPVRLLTHLRTWGWCFNPLSLYFCFDESGEVVDTVVASVTNTPWNEHHEYVFRADADGRIDAEIDKVLHVSPFLGMDQTHRFIIDPPTGEMRVSVENRERGERVFRADMRLQRRVLDRRAMSRLIFRYPFMTWRVSAGIYAQAARLATKGARFHPHPGMKHGGASR